MYSSAVWIRLPRSNRSANATASARSRGSARVSFSSAGTPDLDELTERVPNFAEH